MTYLCRIYLMVIECGNTHSMVSNRGGAVNISHTVCFTQSDWTVRQSWYH